LRWHSEIACAKIRDTLGKGGLMKRILFLCWANCIRSLMAEALLNYRGSLYFRAFSAGIRPASSPHVFTLQALEELHIPVRGLRPKSWHEFEREPFDAIITLSRRARTVIESEWLAPAPELQRPLRAHWEFVDPVTASIPGRVMSDTDRMQAFRDTRDDLRECIEYLCLEARDAVKSPSSLLRVLREAGEDETERLRREGAGRGYANNW
jgi:protein-tyrosine-phosphatase